MFFGFNENFSVKADFRQVRKGRRIVCHPSGEC
jgi:hypothetical protein